MSYIDILGQKAKACKKDIAFASTTQKNDALLEIAHILRVCKDDIIEANKVDLENGRMRKMSEAMLDRLALNDSRIEGMAKACEELAQLDDCGRSCFRLNKTKRHEDRESKSANGRYRHYF